MANVLTVTDANFDAEVIGSDKPVLVDFGATWYGPCKQLAPIVEQIASEYAGRLKVAAVDVDEARDTAMKYGIMSVPTVMFFKAGKVADQFVGFRSKAGVQEVVNRVIG